MLHTKTVKRSTLELLKSLQNKEYLQDFYLGGGTALSLYMGHRSSIDIDLFSNFDFETGMMIELIQQEYRIQLYYTAKNTIKGNINNTNVDIISHRYPYLSEPISTDNLKMLSEQDIIAMKLNAITVSGQRSKDYIDIYYILEKYDINTIIPFYQQKYHQQGEMHVLKSLVYFKDVDLSDWPVLIKDPDLKWDDVQKRIEKRVLEFIKNL